jgi:dihydroflavonol-4-reductase
MMKTFVTGATGFVGSAVVRELLRDGQEVKVLVREGSDTRNLEGLDVERVQGDVTDYSSIVRAMEGSGSVYHVAGMVEFWVPKRDRGKLHQVNVEGTKNVLAAADKLGVGRVVYTSTIAAIGSYGKDNPTNEEHAFNLWRMSTDYEWSKYNAEFEAWRFAARGLPVVIVLPSAPLGPRDIKPNPGGKLILDFLARRLPGYLAGGANFVDVDDVAHGHLLAFQRGRVGQRYILGGENLTTLDLFRALERISGVSAPRFRFPYVGALGVAHLLRFISDHVTESPPLITPPVVQFSSKHYYMNTSRAERELGFRPRTTIPQAAVKAIRWFLDHGYVGGGEALERRIRDRIERAEVSPVAA